MELWIRSPQSSKDGETPGAEGTAEIDVKVESQSDPGDLRGCDPEI